MKHISGAPLLDRLLALPTNMQSSMERLARDKCASLLLNCVTYDRKKFSNIGHISLLVLPLFYKSHHLVINLSLGV